MGNHVNGDQSPLRVFAFDNMRVRSHIFARLFSQHPQFKHVYHPYWIPCFLVPERMTLHFRHSERRNKEVEEDWVPIYEPDTYGTSRKRLEIEIADIEKTDKSPWINERSGIVVRQDIMLAHIRGHEYTAVELGSNPTYLPDWLWETCKPVLVIRHPALSVPSFYAKISSIPSYNLPGDDDFYFCTSLHYSRMFFEVLDVQGQRPAVVDGEDVILRRKQMTDNVCQALGIDPEGITEKWEPTPVDQRSKNPIIAGFPQTIHQSTGEERPSEQHTSPTDINEVQKRLVIKYGEKVAGQLREYIDMNVPDYEYLKQFAV